MKSLTPAVLLIALALAVGPAAVPSNATTEHPQTWAVAPATAEGPDGRGVIEHVVEPGDTYEDYVAVRNLGATELSVELSVHGAVQNTENEFGLIAEGDASSQLAAWASLEKTKLRVEPGEDGIVMVTFTVPADAEPGDISGGIVALGVADEGPEAHGADLRYQVGTRVHLRVAGPVEPSLRFDDARASVPWTLLPFARLEGAASVTSVNTGNVRLTPTVRIEARALFGLWHTVVDVDGAGELLPDGARNIAGKVPEIPQLGPIWVTFSAPNAVSIDQDVSEMLEVEEATTVVWAVPWTVIVFVLLIGGAAAIAIRNLRLRRATHLGVHSQEPESEI